MSTAGLFIFLALMVLVALATLAPLIGKQRQKPQPAETMERQRDRLQVAYERVLTNLRDLDEDLATGKITEDEYAPDREKHMQRGVEVLKALDALNAAHKPPRSEAFNNVIDEAIEARVRAYRQKSQAEEEIEARVRAYREQNPTEE